MPPKFFINFFRWYCRPKLHDHIEGDLLEVYQVNVRRFGKYKADLIFIAEVLLLFRPGIIKPAKTSENLNMNGMYRSYFKIGWRNLLRYKGYSLLNILGLAVGMSAALLNALLIEHELSYNKYFDNYERIAQVTETGLDLDKGGRWTGTSMTYPLSIELTSSYAPNFKRIARTSWDVDNIISAGELKMSAHGLYVDKDFPEIFSFKMLSGSSKALDKPQSVLIAGTLAKALFGNDNAVGKVISLNNKTEVKVGGVFEDFPDNTKFYGMQFFVPWNLFLADNKWIEERAQTDLRNHFLKIYVELAEGSSFENTTQQISSALQFAPEDLEQAKKRDQRLQLYPMSKWHLFPTNVRPGQYSPMFMLKLVGIVGIFILILACINFVNLTTARSERRAKEVGIRKTIGSLRSQLIHQFLGESLLVVCFAFVLAVILTSICLPVFNNIATKTMVMPWTSGWFWAAGVLFVVVTSLLAGSWPAIHLSSFNPASVLKGSFRIGRFHAAPRKVLVVFQFCISVILVVGTIVVHQQVSYVKDRPVGYEREGLIMVKKRSADFDGKYTVLRNELKNTGVVLEVSESMGTMTEVASGNNGWDWKGRDPQVDISFATLSVSHLQGRTAGWRFLQGRDFDIDQPGDSSGIIINESALRYMGLTRPIGEQVSWTWGRDKRVMHYTILGVVKDMVMSSPYSDIQPTFFYLKGFNGNPNWINIRVNPEISIAEALPKIETVFKRIIPAAPFEYKFADEEYAMKFGKEERLAQLATIFASIAIFISSLGVLGLSSFIAEQRTKEIGIRKVLGASVGDVLQMLSKDFVLLVLISCLIASPLSDYLFTRWLQQFNYHTEISSWLFLFVAVLATAITLIIISFHGVKTALMNPVKSLRSE